MTDSRAITDMLCLHLTGKAALDAIEREVREGDARGDRRHGQARSFRTAVAPQLSQVGGERGKERARGKERERGKERDRWKERARGKERERGKERARESELPLMG